MHDSALDSRKHPKRNPTHLRDAVKNERAISQINEETMVFDIGSPNLERNYPHYHILQQAPMIRKRNKGTTKTKGSQMLVNDLGRRDYEQVHWNGKTFSKEYSRNVRGLRKPNSATIKGGNFTMNPDANAYVNEHYKYLDKICDDVTPLIAHEFGLTLLRKQDSGLIDEFADQESITIDQVIEMFDTFNIGE